MALLLLLLPLQFGVSYFIDELYPGITGPGFAGRPAMGGVVRFVACEAHVACGDGARHAVACGDLIERSGHRSIFILRTALPQNRPQCAEPVLAPDAGLRASLRYLRERIHRANARCAPPSAELRSWLRDHSARATGCTAPEALELVWQDVAIDLATNAETRTQRSRHVVAFEAAGAP